MPSEKGFRRRFGVFRQPFAFSGCLKLSSFPRRRESCSGFGGGGFCCLLLRLNQDSRLRGNDGKILFQKTFRILASQKLALLVFRLPYLSAAKPPPKAVFNASHAVNSFACACASCASFCRVSSCAVRKSSLLSSPARKRLCAAAVLRRASAVISVWSRTAAAAVSYCVSASAASRRAV